LGFIDRKVSAWPERHSIADNDNERAQRERRYDHGTHEQESGSDPQSPPLREEILAELIRQGVGSDVLDKPVGLLDKDSRDWLHDAAYDALLNAGLVVESYEAEQDKGAYAVNIIGVPGAYYIEAAEYDNMGFFETLEEARKALDLEYGEFLVS
jgi:hypothetical protein